MRSNQDKIRRENRGDGEGITLRPCLAGLAALDDLAARRQLEAVVWPPCEPLDERSRAARDERMRNAIRIGIVADCPVAACSICRDRVEAGVRHALRCGAFGQAPCGAVPSLDNANLGAALSAGLVVSHRSHIARPDGRDA